MAEFSAGDAKVQSKDLDQQSFYHMVELELGDTLNAGVTLGNRC